MSNAHEQSGTDSVKQKKSAGEKAFELFCACIFLGMIGLVFYNAVLRYVFRSSFPPSEEWARFLFMYITFFGGIEAFYRNKHIAVDMFVDMTHGITRKTIHVIAHILSIGAMAFLFYGGVMHVMTTYDTVSPSTGVNMGLITGILPIMAFCATLFMIRDLFRELKKPLSAYEKQPDDYLEHIQQ